MIDYLNRLKTKRIISWGATMQSFLLSVGEKFIPILKNSKFKETGLLTPEEVSLIQGNFI